MKKRIKQFLIFSMLALFLFSVKSSAWGMDEVHDVAQEVLKKWLDQYTAESCTEEERLKTYYFGNYSSFSTYEEFQEGGDIVVKMGVLVYPVKENSSKWSQYEKYSYENAKDGVGYQVPDYYIRMSKIDGQYQIVYMDFVPEGYEEYVQKMKDKGIDVENLDLEKLLNTEYQETTQITEQNGEVQEFKTEKNEVIEKNTRKITLFCGLMIAVCLAIYIKKIAPFITK